MSVERPAPGDEDILPDLHQRVSRAGRARALGAPARARRRRRQIGCAALAVALTGASLPGGDDLAVAQYAEAAAVPGLAAAAPLQFAAVIEAIPVAGEAAVEGDAARPLRIVGSDSDHARAQLCLTQAIYYEAASEGAEGQRAVAQVVLNRVAHPAFPSTVCGVVYQGSERSTGCQFTFTCDGSLARRPDPAVWRQASRIAREALAGAVYAPVGLATHYHTLAVSPYWAPSLDHLATVGFHTFYRWSGEAGQRAAFVGRYRGGEPLPGRGASSMPAPDPLAPPPSTAWLSASYPAHAPPGAAPASPADAGVIAAPAPAGSLPQGTTAADLLPTAGAVREEYAASGSWLREPGAALAP